MKKDTETGNLTRNLIPGTAAAPGSPGMSSVGGGKGKGVALGELETGLYLLFKLRMCPVPTNIWAVHSPTQKNQEVWVAETMQNATDKNNYLNQDKSQCLCWFKMLRRLLYSQSRTVGFPLYLLPK